MVVLFVAFLTPKVLQISALQARSNNLEVELQNLKAENKSLETELRLLRDDPVYIERVAREKLSKAKEGEIVYRVVRDGDEKTPKNRS